MSAQTHQERLALHRAWMNDPKVAAFEKAVREHARKSVLTGADGVTESLRFASAWLLEHGNLPDSGILSD